MFRAAPITHPGDWERRLASSAMHLPSSPFRKPVPGRLFEIVKWTAYFESVLFACLLFFWIAPGYKSETAIFGGAHGIGFVGLCIVMWFACIRREAPYPLFAATLTPVGPFGSLVGIYLIESRGWGIAQPGQSPEEGIDRSGGPVDTGSDRRD